MTMHTLTEYSITQLCVASNPLYDLQYIVLYYQKYEAHTNGILPSFTEYDVHTEVYTSY